MPPTPSATIEPLSEQPSWLPVVARWVWETWGTKTYQETMESMDDPADCPPTLVAVERRRPIGVISFGRFRREGDSVETLWLNSLFVLQESRSMGLGSRLLAAAIDSARSVANELYVYTDVAPWYEHRGWTVIESTGDNSVLRLRL